MRRHAIMDGNEAVATVAHRINEVIAIYPITPSSAMGEHADGWSTEGRTNLWGAVPDVVEMQSEGGAAGALHGALQGGALATTFTASQGLLLMIPTLYKLAGELTPVCLHVAARTIATHALSIFGDHSDVMAVRQTGVALLASGTVQDAHDMALIGQAASLRGRLPVLHFFDGFRTSHELTRIALLQDADLHALLDAEAIAAHRRRALSPDHPVLRGTAQNPDTFFQASEASNPYYDAMPRIVQETMDRFAERTGRRYRLFEYTGHPEAERVMVLMGSGAETVRETVQWMVERGERVGVVTVRLYRPFDVDAFTSALPATATVIAALDRTREPGAVGDPLYLDVVAALHTSRAAGVALPQVIGGRYGIASREFTPAMVRGIFDEMARPSPKPRFTVGICDDVTHRSVPWDPTCTIEPDDVLRAVFWGLGSDGTVGAARTTIRIVGDATPLHPQGYFVYDSKKAGAVTVSHLRFSPRPVRAPWLIDRASFVACHQWEFLDRYDVLQHAAPGATVLLNAPYRADQVWAHLPQEVRDRIRERDLTVHAIDAHAVAREAGLGGRINTVMQTCFFALTTLVPVDDAVTRIKRTIQDTWGKRGSAIVDRNLAAVDRTLAALAPVPIPAPAEELPGRHRPPPVPEVAPDFVQRVTAVMLAGRGEDLPVSAFPPDGTWPTGTTRWEKRNLAAEIPQWDPAICIQCNWCAMVCPHAAIRAKACDPAALTGVPETFRHTAWRGPDLAGAAYILQVAPEDCTGCNLCVTVCPAKDKGNPRHKAIDMVPRLAVVEREHYRHFLALPDVDRAGVHRLNAKTSQLFLPLFEYSGACAGCGETPYLKLLTQLFGDRAVVANATGCSSIYGGNLPTTPWTTGPDGRGPAWANSLFEDNAEFGFGIRLALDAAHRDAKRLVRELAGELGDALVAKLLAPMERSAAGVVERRAAVDALRARCRALAGTESARLLDLAESLVPRSVWLVGGDGWAYDIGYGGLDHVLAQDRDVNILVLDTEVYSNTGGQQSKATPIGAVAKFAMAGKATGKKDLGLEAMSYGHVYVARVALGADMNQVVKAMHEAESWHGPSLIIAYSPCIAHGYDLRQSAEQTRLAVASGAWPLYRFDPRRTGEGQPPFQLDSKPPSISLRDYQQHEMRFRMVDRVDRTRARQLEGLARQEVERRWAVYTYLAGLTVPSPAPGVEPPC